MERVKQEVPVSVVCLTSVEPLKVVFGSEVNEIISQAGGMLKLNTSGQANCQITPEQLHEANPEVLIFIFERTIAEAKETLQVDLPKLELLPNWWKLRAVRSNRVFVCSSAIFSPQMKVISTKLLADTLHPQAFADNAKLFDGTSDLIRQWPLKQGNRQYPGQRVYSLLSSYHKDMEVGGKQSNEVNASSHPTRPEAAVACRRAVTESIRDITRRHALDSKSAACCVILSGGVDTCAVMQAVKDLGEEGPKVEAAVTVLATPLASDRSYVVPLAASLAPLDHHCLEVDLTAVLAMLPFCVRTLRSFDPMEIRNSMVVALALHKVSSLGYSVALTGDGSDELLGGYSFTWMTEAEDWRAKRSNMVEGMGFSAVAMGRALGVTVASPYLEGRFMRWVLSETNKGDCVGDRPIELVAGGERQMHITGKVCLREAWPTAASAWRRKDPIEVGSGSTELGKGYFKTLISPEELMAGQVKSLKEDRVVIRDEEHLYYYRCFKSEFPNGIEGITRSGDHHCIGCGYALPTVTSMFCTICGAFPAQNTSKQPEKNRGRKRWIKRSIEIGLTVGGILLARRMVNKS